MREREMGGRLMRDMKRRRSTTLLKAESVRPVVEKSVSFSAITTENHRGKRLTSQEAVKLHQELEVHIVALGGLAVRSPDVVGAEIDTCRAEKRRESKSAFGPGMLILASSRSTKREAQSFRRQSDTVPRSLRREGKEAAAGVGT